MSGQHADAAGLRLLVVGASSGIGHAVATSAAERGASVAVAARRMESPTQLADAIGGSAFELDVEDAAAIKRVVDEAAATLGGLDAVVFTSTVVPFAHIEDTDVVTWIHAFAVNAVERTTCCAQPCRTCPNAVWYSSRRATTSAVHARAPPRTTPARPPSTRSCGRGVASIRTCPSCASVCARPRTPRFCGAPTETSSRCSSSRGWNTARSPGTDGDAQRRREHVGLASDDGLCD